MWFLTSEPLTFFSPNVSGQKTTKNLITILMQLYDIRGMKRFKEEPGKKQQNINEVQTHRPVGSVSSAEDHLIRDPKAK